MFVILLAATLLAFGMWRLTRTLEPATVCLTHHATIVRCAPIGSAHSRHRHIRALCRGARRRVHVYASFIDLQSARRMLDLAADLTPGVLGCVYYEPRPMDPESALIHQAMRGLAGSMRGHALRRRAVCMSRFPYIQVASTHLKACIVDDTHYVVGSSNAITGTIFMHDPPPQSDSCAEAEHLWLSPSFIDFDVSFTMSHAVPELCEYLELLAQQRPWAERSLHMTFRDRNEFHVFPAGVLSREGFLAALVDGAHVRVLIGALSVWPTGGFRAALVAAAQRGCVVTMVGSACACSKSQRLLGRLNRCAAASYRGWRYREWTPEHGLIHAKFMLLDDNVVLPSFNISHKAVGASADDELCLVLRGAAAAPARHALEDMVRERTTSVVLEPDPLGNALLAMLNPLL